MSRSFDDSTDRDPRRRVVITGMGAITPVGHTAAETWEALKAGRSGISRYTYFDVPPGSCGIAGDPVSYTHLTLPTTPYV